MRTLDTTTLDNAAQEWAGQFLLHSQFSKKHPEVAIGGREWVMQNFVNMTFKDEFEYLLPKFRAQLGLDSLDVFDRDAEERLTPREDTVFEELLAKKLAITPNGEHILGRIGTTVVGSTLVGKRLTRHGMKNALWNLYAGEAEERALGNVREVGKDGDGADPLPPPKTFWPDESSHQGFSVLYAINTNTSIAFAQAGVNAALDLLDEGTVDGVIEGRTGAQPVDPDAATTGTLLFSLDLGTPAFGNASDGAPNAVSTASPASNSTRDEERPLEFIRR